MKLYGTPDKTVGRYDEEMECGVVATVMDHLRHADPKGKFYTKFSVNMKFSSGEWATLTRQLIERGNALQEGVPHKFLGYLRASPYATVVIMRKGGLRDYFMPKPVAQLQVDEQGMTWHTRDWDRLPQDVLEDIVQNYEHGAPLKPF